MFDKIGSSAAYRIAFIYTAAFLLVIVLLGTAVFFAADANFRGQQDAAIGAESDELLHEYRSGGASELRANIARREADSIADAFGYAVFAADGRRLIGRLDTKLPESGWQNIVFNDPVEKNDAARALVTPLSHGLILVVALDSEAVEQLDINILMLFIGALILMLACGTGGAILLGGYLQHRLEHISGTAQAILAGDISSRVPSRAGGDEFDRLGRSLNAMLDRIVNLLENLQQVSSDVAHDLRTPLARLRGEIEAAIEGPLDVHVQREALHRALDQSDRMMSLFTAILRISEVEGGALVQTFERIDLSALIEDLCESYSPVVQDGGRLLTCGVTPQILVFGDRELVAQALVNLLDNAQVHTPEGTHILVHVEVRGIKAHISVVDDGPGVPADDRLRISKRFVRLDNSRNSAGNGLGLNLVSAIAALHGGDLEISDNRPGLCVTITVPRIIT